jgi:hypothetical protein
MDTTTIVLAAVAAVFGALWIMRRRSRLRSDQFE